MSTTPTDTNKELCGCACHTHKLAKDGFIHDSICCDKLNGSLEWRAVQDAVNKARLENKANWTLELPDLPHFQIFAFKDNETGWHSPMYDTNNLPVQLKGSDMESSDSDKHTEASDEPQSNSGKE